MFGSLTWRLLQGSYLEARNLIEEMRSMDKWSSEVIENCWKLQVLVFILNF